MGDMRDLRRKADDLPANVTEEEKEKIVQKMQKLNTAVLGCVNAELAACLAPGDKGALTCFAGDYHPLFDLLIHITYIHSSPLSHTFSSTLIHLSHLSHIIFHASSPPFASVDGGDISVCSRTRLRSVSVEGLLTDNCQSDDDPDNKQNEKERHPPPALHF